MIIAIASGKGGTGKSTITLNLAGALSAKMHRVFVVDADPQGSIARWSKIAKQKDPTIVVNPSPKLGRKTRRVTERHDLVLFDAPPTFKKRMRSVLRTADKLIIPVTPGLADFWSTQKLIDIYIEEKERNPYLDARLLISRVDRRTKAGREFRPFLEKLSIPIFITEIPQRAIFGETWQTGLTNDRLKPGSDGAEDFRNLAVEVIRWLERSWRLR